MEEEIQEILQVETVENKMRIPTTEQALNELLVMVATAFVLLMQLGLAFLENGLVRPKNSKNILIKNVFDACISGLTFWLIGFGLAFGIQEDSS